MLPYRATINLIKSTNVAIWNDTPNLLYTLLGCVYFYQNENNTYFINVGSGFTLRLFNLPNYKWEYLFRDV